MGVSVYIHVYIWYGYIGYMEYGATVDGYMHWYTSGCVVWMHCRGCMLYRYIVHVSLGVCSIVVFELESSVGVSRGCRYRESAAY